MYIFSLFSNHSTIEKVLGILAIIAIFVSFKGATRTFQIISIVFLIAGFILFFTNPYPLYSLPNYFTSTALLLSLLYFLPYINNMIQIGRYDTDLKNLLKLRANHLGKIYYRSSLIAYVLCLFVFFSSITIVHGVVKDVTKQANQQIIDKLSSQSILRSFALANVWSPIEIFIALTVTITGVSYFELFPWALLFSILLLLIDWVYGWFKY
ncbi:hypothetical protein [Halobacillus seohaensis]|uniref:hypothetical protein n=1 Tax=Halobacillus seohaensis TaxID=447421 RepID=UPI0036F43676